MAFSLPMLTMMKPPYQPVSFSSRNPAAARAGVRPALSEESVSASDVWLGPVGARWHGHLAVPGQELVEHGSDDLVDAAG